MNDQQGELMGGEVEVSGLFQFRRPVECFQLYLCVSVLVLSSRQLRDLLGNLGLTVS